MKKRFLNLLMAGVLSAGALAGCRKTPDASANSDVYHAESSLENDVENISAGEADGAESAGRYEALVGTEENDIWICAQVPAVPQAAPAALLHLLCRCCIRLVSAEWVKPAKSFTHFLTVYFKYS